ncbi:TPA: hypothetical protein DEW05_05180 [Candidatus Saccharibacteria bacterium]|nr:hypothetical protein [Candidatus Saccharibacteria bacterium]
MTLMQPAGLVLQESLMIEVGELSREVMRFWDFPGNDTGFQASSNLNFEHWNPDQYIADMKGKRGGAKAVARWHELAEKYKNAVQLLNLAAAGAFDMSLPQLYAFCVVYTSYSRSENQGVLPSH